jgi:uncharacterized membrane protein
MLGPLQLTVIGFDEDKYARDIILEIKSLRQAKTIRLVDLLYVFKHADGTIDSKEATDLQEEEQREFGTLLRSLVGLSKQDTEHADADAVAESLKSAGDQFGFSSAEIKDLADRIPNNSSAILVIFEHAWARRVKAAIVQAGGYLRAQGLIDPATLQTATNELAAVLEAVEKSEAAAMDKLVDTKVGAEAEAEEARAQAAAAIADAEAKEAAAVAALAAAALREKEAAEAVAAAEAREEEARQQAAKAAEEAQTREEEARQQLAKAIEEAQAQEDQAFADLEAVKRAAKRQEEQAMARAAEVERQAKEMEDQAVLKAMDALVAANYLERRSSRDAIDALIAANVLDASVRNRNV